MKNSTKNVFTGTRKLSTNKKTSKKSLKKNSKKLSKNSKHSRSSEEIMDILNSDTNTNFRGKTPSKPKNNNYDPMIVNTFVPTDANGKIQGINSIGNLLGGLAEVGEIPSLVPNDNTYTPDNNEYNLSEMSMMSNQLPQFQGAPQMQYSPYAPQMQMPQMQMPQMQQMHQLNQMHQMHQMNQMQAPQMQVPQMQVPQMQANQFNPSIFKNLSQLGGVTKLV